MLARPLLEQQIVTLKHKTAPDLTGSNTQALKPGYNSVFHHIWVVLLQIAVGDKSGLM